MLWVAGVLWLLLPVPLIESAFAQPARADADGARMDISGYSIEGRYLLDSQDFTRLVAPLIGRGKSAADIERTRSAVQQEYHNLGYCEVRVSLDQPRPVDGVIKFRVTEIPASEVGPCAPKTVKLAEQPASLEPARPAAAPAASAAAPALRFSIESFEVTGNTLLPVPVLKDVLAPYTGRDKDFAAIQQAQQAVEAAYRERGYGVVQVLVPEQDISRGVVQFRVIEPRIGTVSIEGNTHFDDRNIRHSLPSVREGETPNAKEIARNLQLAGEHPVKQTSAVLRPGEGPDRIDMSIRVADDKPWRGFLTLDNTGTSETGYTRAGVGLQHSNLFNRDHILTGQYVTSPSEPDQVSIYGLGYRVPFYGINSSLDLIAGYSDVDSGVVQGLFNVSGSGSIAIVRWNMVLPKAGDIEQKLSFGLDYRAFDNEVQFQGSGNLVPDVVIHPVSVNYGALWRGAAAELSFYGNYSRNIPGGNDGRQEDWRSDPASRQTVVDDYQILRYGFNYVGQLWSEWQARLGFSGQTTGDALVPGEQFGIGGPDTVRGYLLRELARDKGYATQLELYTPDFARGVGLPDRVRTRLLAFYDYGSVENNDTDPSDQQSLASRGAGLRAAFGKSLSMRFDFAQILKATADREKYSWRTSYAFALIF